MSSHPSPPGVKRDCACPIARHEHGTTGGYDADRCRCLECRAAAAAAYRRRYRLKAYGQFRSRMVDPIGTRRRCHALMTLGWPLSAVAERVGINRRQLALNIAGHSEMLKATADKIAEVYDELWNTPPVATTKGERIAVAMTLQRALRGGYAPPLAWDDIDDPDARPNVVGDDEGGLDEIAVERFMSGTLRDKPRANASPERAEAIRRLAVEYGMNDARIGQRVGMTTTNVGWFRHRHGIPAGVRASGGGGVAA